MPPKKTVKNDDLCASGLTDVIERKIMATAMKQGEEQINIVRQAKKQESKDLEDDE